MTYRSLARCSVVGLAVVAAIYICRPSLSIVLTLFPRSLHLTGADRYKAIEALGPVTDVHFNTSDGIEISGWYIPSQINAVVILIHGANANRMQMLPEAGALI